MYSLSDNNNKRIQEKLVVLQEECSEVIQAVCKIKRFGYKDFHPITKKTNDNILEEELGDLLQVIDEVIEDLGIDKEKIAFYKKSKKQKLNKYLKQI